MKALITGARGQLGRALLAKRPAGWDCVQASRSDADLSDFEAIRELVRRNEPDLLLNAGAYTDVDQAESDQATAYAVNAAAVGVLSETAHECGAHFVHVSTDFVFDGRSGQAYPPDAARNPLSVYGLSKAAGEDAAGQGSTIVRTSWVHGAGTSNFVTKMLRIMRERAEVRVVADQIGSPTWVDGLAETVWNLGIRRLAGTWHYSDAGIASWYDFAVIIQDEALNCGLLPRVARIEPISSSEFPTAARRPPFSVLDSSLTHRALGTPKVHWKHNLRRMLEQTKKTEVTLET